MQLLKRKIYESGRSLDLAARTTALIISNEEMKQMMKTVKSPEESGLLVKRISATIKNETKERKGGFLSMLLGALAASLLGSALTGKGVIRAVKAQLEQAKIFNDASSFNKF